MGKIKIQKRLLKNQKSLLIALLLGDGTISNNNVFKICHACEQEEFLIWKLKQLDESNIKNNGIKRYIASCGYNKNKEVVYSQLSIIPTIKALRRCVYRPTKKITRSLLDWLDARGLAIWYLDDGHINVNTSVQRKHVQHTFKIAVCSDLETINIIINYFKEVWSINFRKFPEGKNTYSIATCSETDAENFSKIIAPYIKEIPSMLYKIRKNMTKQEFLEKQSKGLKCETLV